MLKYVMMMALMIAVPVIGHTQNDEYDVEAPLKAVYANSITLDYASDSVKSEDVNRTANGELSFKFDAKTKYVGFNKLSDLKEGDVIGVDYRQDRTRADSPDDNIAEVIALIDYGEVPADSTSQTTTVTTVTTTNTATTTAP